MCLSTPRFFATMVSMKRIIDIKFGREGLAGELSNLTERPFTLGGIEFASMEGFLQSVKIKDHDWVERVRGLHGVRAWKIGQEGNAWKQSQTLWFRQLGFPRSDLVYQQLLDAAYREQLRQNERFAEALRESVGYELCHDMGKDDPADTVLTREEYIGRLNHLRWRVLEEGRRA